MKRKASSTGSGVDPPLLPSHLIAVGPLLGLEEESIPARNRSKKSVWL